MKKTNKKGFTIVELVIVIAVIAILSAVLIPTFSGIIRKANVANDTQLVRNLNTALKADEAIDGKPVTMYDALQVAESEGYIIENINAKAADNKILWDSEANVFCYLNDGKIKYIPNFDKNTAPDNADLWEITADLNSPYSIYYVGDETSVTVAKSFDAGKKTVDVTFTGTKAVIRTNGGDLTVNSATADVNHYGWAEEVNVLQAAPSSYHLFGSVDFLKVTQGRVEIKEDAKIDTIVIAPSKDTSAIKVENKTAEIATIVIAPVFEAEADKADAIENIAKAEIKGVETVENVIIDKEVIGAEEAATKIEEVVKAVVKDIKDDVVADIKEKTEEVIKDTTDEAVMEEIKDNSTGFAGGDGTQANPYIIKSFNQIQKIDDYYERGYTYFKVADDVSEIDGSKLSRINLNGSFDGNGVTIKNLRDILFNKAYNPESNKQVVISNLTLNCNISATGATSALVRSAANLLVDNVDVHGSIIGTEVAGYVVYGASNVSSYATKFTFKNCINDASLVATNGGAAGFVDNAIWGSAQIIKDSLITVIDSIFAGSIAASNGATDYFAYQCNNILVKTEYSASFVAKYGNPEGTLYSKVDKVDGVFNAGNYPNISGYNTSKVDAHKLGTILSVVNGSAPTAFGDAYTFTKVANAVSAKVAFCVGPNKKIEETGNYVATFMTEEIDISELAAGAVFSTETIKYWDIAVNAEGVTKQGVSGTTYNIYDGGKFYGTTYGSASINVVQYAANGQVLNVTNITLK